MKAIKSADPKSIKLPKNTQGQKQQKIKMDAIEDSVASQLLKIDAIDLRKIATPE